MAREGRGWRTIAALACVALAPACAHHAVHCEGKLEPINLPAPVRQDTPPKPTAEVAQAGARS